MPAPDPSIKALILCDLVTQEVGTNKWSAIGIFDKIFAISLPVLQSTMGIYVRLADALGKYEISVVVQHVASQIIVAKVDGITLEVKDRKSSADFGLRTRQLLLPQPGLYEVQLMFNNRLRQNTAFEVILPKGEVT